MLIDVFKVTNAITPIVRVTNAQGEQVAVNESDGSHVGYSIEINGQSTFNVLVYSAFVNSDGQQGENIISRFTVTAGSNE